MRSGLRMNDGLTDLLRAVKEMTDSIHEAYYGSPRVPPELYIPTTEREPVSDVDDVAALIENIKTNIQERISESAFGTYWRGALAATTIIQTTYNEWLEKQEELKCPGESVPCPSFEETTMHVDATSIAEQLRTASARASVVIDPDEECAHCEGTGTQHEKLLREAVEAGIAAISGRTLTRDTMRVAVREALETALDSIPAKEPAPHPQAFLATEDERHARYAPVRIRIPVCTCRYTHCVC